MLKIKDNVDLKELEKFGFKKRIDNEEMIKCTIEDKWVKRKDKSDMYLVQCDNEVYQITDLIFKGKFNSSDIYANLKVGNTYEITTTGYRFELLSMYKNINKYEKVEDK